MICKPFILLLFSIISLDHQAHGFFSPMILHHHTRNQQQQITLLYQSFYSSNEAQAQSLKRRNIKLPLLDLTSSSSSSSSSTTYNGYDKTLKNIITPLPASHLPNELSTLHIYGMELKAAIYKMMIEDTLSSFSSSNNGLGSIQLQENIFTSSDRKEPLYGHLIGRNPSLCIGDDNDDVINAKGMDDDNSNNSLLSSKNTLIGAIGCAAEIIISTPSDLAQIETVMDDVSLTSFSDDDSSSSNNNSSEEYSDFDDPLNDGNTEDRPITVLTKGSFRFIVKDVVQMFPYPIAIVDELLDNFVSNKSTQDVSTSNNERSVNNNDNEEEDEDDDDNMYADLNPTELMQRTFSAMKAIVDQKLETKPKNMSPLELSILEGSGMSPDIALGMESMQRNQAEEMAAIFDVFSSSLIDIAPSQTERFFAVAMLAAEFGGLENDIRNQILVTVDGVERLRIVLEALEKKISLVQAKKLTDSIVEKSDESSKDLKVRLVFSFNFLCFSVRSVNHR